MARIDSVLSIATENGCNELRIGTNREPKMLANGVAKPLHLPPTQEDMLRHLLGELLPAERENSLRAEGRVETSYEFGGQPFRVIMTARDDGFDVVFLRARPTTPAVETVLREADDVVVPPSHPARPPSSVEPAELRSTLVHRAIAAGATDLHVADGEVPMIRVNGRLARMGGAPRTIDALEEIGLDAYAADMVSGGSSFERAVTLEGGFRARVHAYRTNAGHAAAVRFLQRTPASLKTLNMPAPLEDVVDLPHGLCLVCGATGSGKSTTLAALAQEALRRRSIVLVTLEQPVEYVLSGGPSSVVRQREVGRDVTDFATGLRDALREDPDVLVVGEMRDPETIALALTAAETGHLVIATLHSGSAAAAVDRIVDAYPPERQPHIRSQVADVLRVVVAQRLVPRARGEGRLPVLEVLRVNHAAASLIREGKSNQLVNVLQSGRREGMLALERCLADRVAAGDIRPEHARAAANDPAALAMYVGK